MNTKHTPGPWAIIPKGKPFAGDIADNTGAVVAQAYLNEHQANARLIAEAGTVATETGLSPREMQQQWRDLRRVLDRRTNERDEMMAALLDVVNIKPATSGADAIAVCDELELLQAKFREIIAPWHPTI